MVRAEKFLKVLAHTSSPDSEANTRVRGFVGAKEETVQAFLV